MILALTIAFTLAVFEPFIPPKNQKEENAFGPSLKDRSDLDQLALDARELSGDSPFWSFHKIKVRKDDMLKRKVFQDETKLEIPELKRIWMIEQCLKRQK